MVADVLMFGDFCRAFKWLKGLSKCCCCCRCCFFFLQKNCLFWGCAVGEFSPFRVLVFLHVRVLDILCDLGRYSKQFAVVCLPACQS